MAQCPGSKAVYKMDDRPTATVELRWEGGQKFTSSDRYGHSLTVDAPAGEDDPFDGFKPGELLLSSLAACSGMDVVGILRKQRQKVTGIDLQVTGAQRPDPPWAWEEVQIRYTLRGRGLSRSAAERAVHLSLTKYCSIAATIDARVSITSAVQIIEEQNGPVQKRG